MSLRRWLTCKGWRAFSSYTRNQTVTHQRPSLTSLKTSTAAYNLHSSVTTMETTSALTVFSQHTAPVTIGLSLADQPITVEAESNAVTHPRTILLSRSSKFHGISGSSLDKFHLFSSLSTDKEYQCPSRILQQFSELVILDQAVPSHSFYDLPLSQNIIHPIIAPNWSVVEEISEPPSSGSDTSPGKYAKEIMKIRHKKMKKHKLRKLRKRMYFVWKKRRLARQSKRDALYRKELEEIKSTGTDFDAKEFVQEQLKKAKRGGYYINIFQSKN